MRGVVGKLTTGTLVGDAPAGTRPSGTLATLIG
jgi:hypothetical protein